MASSKKIGRNVEESVGKALSNIGSMKPDMKGGDTELKSAVAPKKAPSFAEAFRAARKDPEAMKRGTFTWAGKSYTTKMAGEGPKRSGTAPAKAATSAAKPAVKADVSAATRSFVSKLPTKPAADKPAATAKPRTSADRSAEARGRVSKFFSSLNPYNQADAKGKSGRPILLTGDAAREANRKQGTIGGKAKGGKIDGAAIRGKTRAPLKKGK